MRVRFAAHVCQGGDGAAPEAAAGGFQFMREDVAAVTPQRESKSLLSEMLGAGSSGRGGGSARDAAGRSSGALELTVYLPDRKAITVQVPVVRACPCLPPCTRACRTVCLSACMVTILPAYLSACVRASSNVVWATCLTESALGA